MADEATVTLTLDPDLLAPFVAEAGMMMRLADDVLLGPCPSATNPRRCAPAAGAGSSEEP